MTGHGNLLNGQPVEGSGINPVEKTEDMTQPVGIDENGKLWVAPIGGGGEDNSGDSSGNAGTSAEIVRIELSEEGYISWETGGIKKSSGLFHTPLTNVDGCEAIIIYNCGLTNPGAVIAYFDENGTFMQNISIRGEASKTSDPEGRRYDIPEGAYSVIVSYSSAYGTDPYVELIPIGYTEGGNIDTEESTNTPKMLFIGDSITALGGSRDWCQKCAELLGYDFKKQAKSGATWTNFSDTVEGIDLNATHANTMSNHINVLEAMKDENSDLYNVEYSNFNIVVVFAGHNDLTSNDSSFSAAEESILSQFETTNADGGTSLLPLSDVDKTTWGGAMRYVYEKLRGLYPNATIFYLSPIQSASVGTSYRCYKAIKRKGQLIDCFCARVSDVVFVDTERCGINTLYEVPNGEGKYLADGLHPNADGAEKIAGYAARIIKQHL